jgi:hypothetical protein
MVVREEFGLAGKLERVVHSLVGSDVSTPRVLSLPGSRFFSRLAWGCRIMVFIGCGTSM